jgi:hypothetical protein
MESQLRNAHSLATGLGIRRLYLVTPGSSEYLSEAEYRFMHANKEGCLAFTSPVCDLLFKNALRYQWSGRGCCVVFVRSPMLMAETQTLGMLIHELGHYVADCHKPCRDDNDHDRALKQSWSIMETEEQQHDRKWLRATVHLFHRACLMGYEIPFSNVVNLEQYGYSRSDIGPLLSEASAREREPIEQLVSSMRQKIRKTTARQRMPRAKPVMIGGQMVLQHSNGSIETLPGLDGKGGGQTFKTVRQFLSKAS